ncbi:Ribosomal RNA small subunit methyltransferase E [Paraliobacillus sp. PM-2]|uniref:16S rRNA (uracil(1498)-N(3))-methyltransferase n=1 Tax=Paraliobacillus sp. PM-2 TaxID=1462524 RepID=UPI00061C8390|nr:16S rRNA (uracil(1498)-N(3))-methyltransferase [Paraliobacillus sp. PM-2]CQR46893.1 Ribosomal RNA small subunit methyltransferase E [Paraliobacillus sp. PM-2]
MQHYFVPMDQWTASEVFITGDDYHHINRVMRMHNGDQIICNRPDGQAAICLIENITENEVVANIVSWIESNVEMPIKVAIAQAFPKGDKLDLILQKGTELGAVDFFLFQGARSIVKWDAKKTEKKLLRYRKIVKEAAEQSHRTCLPNVTTISNLSDLVKHASMFDHKLVAYEETTRLEKSNKLHEIYQKIHEGESVFICIGPEGGFSETEIATMKQNGFTCVRLGPRILRTETAGLYALASLSYHFEEME